MEDTRPDNVGMVRSLLQWSRGEVACSGGIRSLSLLLTAARSGNIEMVGPFLLYTEQDRINSAVDLLWAALRDAALRDRVEVLKLLIQRSIESIHQVQSSAVGYDTL